MRALRRQAGFGLYLAVYDAVSTRDEAIRRLAERTGRTPRHVVVTPGPASALDQVLADRGEPGGPLMVHLAHDYFGSAADRPEQRDATLGRADAALLSLNLDRPRWRAALDVPVVFWASQTQAALLLRAAPDFFDWRSGSFCFEADDRERLAAAFADGARPRDDGLPGASFSMLADDRRRRIAEMETLLDESRSTSGTERTRADLHVELGDLYAFTGDRERAERHYEASASLARGVDDARRRALAALHQGDLALRYAGPKPALSFYQSSLELFREVAREAGETPQALRDVAVSLERVGDAEAAERGPAAALPRYAESLAICRRVVERFGETPEALRDLATALQRTAAAQAADGKKEAGLADARETLRLLEGVGERWGVNWQIRDDIEKTKRLIAWIGR